MIDVNIPLQTQKLLISIENRLGMLAYRSSEILAKSINTTATKVRTLLMKKTKADVAVVDPAKKKEFKASTLKKYSASINNLVAKLVAKGIASELYSFDVSPRNVVDQKNKHKKEIAYSARVYTSETAKRLQGFIGSTPKGKITRYKPFVIKFGSGHITLATRIPGRKMKNGKKEFVEKLFAPSVPVLIKQRGRDELATEMVYQILPQEIDKHIEKVLNEARNI